MNLAPFHEVKLRIEELRASKEYADDTVVDGLYNRAELLIKRISDTQFKDNLIRMFNEIKVRTRSFNNNQKLLALENLFSNIINTVEAEKLFQNPAKFFNVNEAIDKVKRTKGHRDNETELVHYQRQYAESTYRAALQEKQASAIHRFFEYPFIKWIVGILSALFVAYIIFRLGWN